MTKTEFKAICKRLALSRNTAAKVLRCSLSSVATWRREGNVPGPVAALLGLLDKHPEMVAELLALVASPKPKARRRVVKLAV